MREDDRGEDETSTLRRELTRARAEIASLRAELAGARASATPRDEAEQALRHAQRLSDRVQELTGTGSWELDLETSTMYGSAEARRIYGLPDGPSSLAATKAVVLPAHRPTLDAALAACIAHGAKYDEQFQIRRGDDGVIRDVRSVGYYDAARRRVSGFIQDVTELRRAEADHARLEALLRQAERMESVGRLAGGVAHDFNNMLGVILGNVSLALEAVDPGAPLFEELDEIRRAAQRSAELTRQLLAFARKQTISPKVLDLNATIASALRMLGRLVGDHVRLEWAPARELWPVCADPSQIDQVLANLCVNARDAIVGAGTLRIETDNVALDERACEGRPGFAPGEFVLLTVRDDGRGMDEATLAHVFEPFFTTKGVGEGTGLGLSTVYGIVTQSHGFVHVESEPGHGTTFSVYFPRHAASEAPARPASEAAPSRGELETILVVEDDSVLLRLVTRMLAGLGYTALSASSASEGLRVAAAHAGAIELLLSDVVMPKVDGLSLAKRLTAIRPGLRTLFMSGYPDEVVAEHGALAPAARLLTKPFTQAKLAAAVRAALEGRGGVG